MLELLKDAGESLLVVLGLLFLFAIGVVAIAVGLSWMIYFSTPLWAPGFM